MGVEPGEQRLQPRPQQTLGLEQLAEVQQIGQPTFAVDPRQQPFGHRLFIEPGTEHAHKALLLPKLVITLGGFAFGVPLLLIVLAASEIGGATAQQARGQGIAQQAFATGLGVGGQHRGQLAGLLAAPDAVAPTAHAGHTACGQFISDHPCLPVVGHQHGDIATLERCELAVLVETSTALCSACQLQGNTPCGVARRQLPCLTLAQRIVAEPDKRQRRRLVRLHQPQTRTRLVGRTYCWIAQIRLGKRLRVIEQLVQRGDQLRRRAVIGRQVEGLAIRLLLGGHIGRQIRTAEGVDRLLGIADKTQRRLAGLCINAVEDGVLDRVGVLELVDQRQRIGRTQRGRQVFADGALQGLIQPVEQIVEGQQPLRRLALRQFAVEPFEQCDLQGDQPLLAGRQRFGDLIGQFIQCMGQLTDRRVIALLTGLVQSSNAEFGRAVGQVEHHCRVGKIGVQFHLPGGELDVLVGALAEPAMGQQLRNPSAASSLPQLGSALPGRFYRTQVGCNRRILRLHTQVRLTQMAAQPLA